MLKRLSIISIAGLTVLAALVMSLPRPATASSPAVVDVKNESTNCAWVTVYDRGVLTRYTILRGYDRPKFFAPGDSHHYSHLGVWRFKVRAEVMPSEKCSGRKVADREFITAGNNDRLYIRGSGRSFTLGR